MPFTSLPTRNVGDPVFANDNVLIKDNFDDHESRISALEANDKRIIVFNATVYNAASFSTATGLAFYRAIQDFTLTEAIITIFTKGSLTGTLEIDIKKSTSLNPVGFGSVFTTKPSITYASASDYDDSINAVFDITNKSVAQDEWLRFDISQTPASGIISKFHLILKGEI